MAVNNSDSDCEMDNVGDERISILSEFFDNTVVKAKMVSKNRTQSNW